MVYEIVDLEDRRKVCSLQAANDEEAKVAADLLFHTERDCLGIYAEDRHLVGLVS